MKVASTTAMTDIIMEIMVEVLRIFGMATKELRQGSASEFWISCLWIFSESHGEKFFRKLAGMVDLEDSLKKLDRLMQEEARMALAVKISPRMSQKWLRFGDEVGAHNFMKFTKKYHQQQEEECASVGRITVCAVSPPLVQTLVE